MKANGRRFFSDDDSARRPARSQSRQHDGIELEGDWDVEPELSRMIQQLCRLIESHRAGWERLHDAEGPTACPEESEHLYLNITVPACQPSSFDLSVYDGRAVIRTAR
jgi:hypothetical protein